jgi:glycosyltransferase involved in cell wall biosynthesis
MALINCKLSVVIPVFNEHDSLHPLMERLSPVLGSLGNYEIIFVNDGSTDDTAKILDDLYEENWDSIKVIHMRTNCGKSVGLQCGFGATSGELIVMMDADLQDRPEEIPNLIRHLEENNLDVVTGWKFKRFDPKSKTLPSRLFNYVVRKFSGVNVHDFNCGLKVMRRECVEHLKLYGQLHRFMLVLLAEQGFKIGECKVQHAPRKYGTSKYKSRRLYEGIMDFFTIFFITRYMHSPLHFFGFYGLSCFVISFFYSLFFIGGHIVSLLGPYPNWSLGEHPIWVLGPVLFLIGIIFIFFGLIGELINHVFSTELQPKFIRKRIGFETEEDRTDKNAK